MKRGNICFWSYQYMSYVALFFVGKCWRVRLEAQQGLLGYSKMAEEW